jgi:hypothetical protein
LSLLAPVLTCGCEDDDDGAPQLGSGHEGWGNPGCWGCHDSGSTHNSNLQPYECVECHGLNGAPGGHGGQPPCGECHDQPHGNNGFPDPESCQTCHSG